MKKNYIEQQVATCKPRFKIERYYNLTIDKMTIEKYKRYIQTHNNK